MSNHFSRQFISFVLNEHFFFYNVPMDKHLSTIMSKYYTYVDEFDLINNRIKQFRSHSKVKEADIQNIQTCGCSEVKFIYKHNENFFQNKIIKCKYHEQLQSRILHIKSKPLNQTQRHKLYMFYLQQR